MLSHERVAVIDTETTGLEFSDPGRFDAWGRDALCSLSVILMRRGEDGLYRPYEQACGVFDPGRPVHPGAGRVNGFHRSSPQSPLPPGRTELAGRPAFRERAAAVREMLDGCLIVAHNAKFDLEVLDVELEAAGLPVLGGEYACTREAFADMTGKGRHNRYAAGTRLDDLCDALGIPRGERRETHGANVDSRLCALAFQRLEREGWMRAEAVSSLPHRCGDPALGPT